MTSFRTATSGNYNAVLTTFSGANTFASVLAHANAGSAHVNVHNANFLSGEIRGNLIPLPQASTCAMMLAGLAAVGAIARRRRARS